MSRCLLLVPLTLPPSLEFLNASSGDFSAGIISAGIQTGNYPTSIWILPGTRAQYLSFHSCFFGFVFWLCSILVPQPGIKPDLAVKAPSLNHWTTREFPFHSCFKNNDVLGTLLVAQWLRLQASTAGGMGSVPGQGIKIPHAAWWSQKVGGKKWMRMIKSIPSICWNPCFSYPVCWWLSAQQRAGSTYPFPIAQQLSKKVMGWLLSS